eukprot:2068172-Lingulodinium_polyedra.AAC.1
MYGAIDGLQHARKVLPRCVAGRWGSCTSTETAVLAAGREQLTSVFVSVFRGKAKNASDQSNAPHAPPLCDKPDN